MAIGFSRDLLKPLLVALLLPITLAACASLAGSPPRVIGVQKSLDLVDLHKMNDAITRFNESASTNRGGLTPRQYRDMVVTIYLNAIDAQYYEFRRRVSSERRELGLGLDLVVAGFTGGASVARASIVNELSAAAAGFAGARGAIDRNVYFDRALPGLLAAMDAQRIRVLTQITTNLQKNAGEYPLVSAFAELSAYEMAGSLDRAIEQVAAQAVQDRERAQNQLNNVVRACRAEADAVEVADRLSRYIYGLAESNAAGVVPEANLMKLRLAATALEVSPSGSADDVLDAILTRIQIGRDGRCGRADIEEMIRKIQALIGGSI